MHTHMHTPMHMHTLSTIEKKIAGTTAAEITQRWKTKFDSVISEQGLCEFLLFRAQTRDK